MSKSPFHLRDLAQPIKAVDPRLWTPRLRGDRESGGHAVLAAAAFTEQNQLYILVVDSDWSEPRVWNFDQVFTQATSFDGVEFYSCY